MLQCESGSLFGGRYEVIRCIGAGGMGAVYLASDSRYKQFPVALKVLYPGIIKTRELRERFRNEIIASYKVLHRNVVRAYEYFDEEHVQAYVMEYVEGIDLHTRIKEGRISIDDAMRILYQAAAGMEAIHAAGIVHRDLKPENILLTRKNFAKIADFGVARLKTATVSLTQVGAMVGTPKYFSPEYIEFGESDHRGDVYALGVIGYEVITGTSPFKSQTPDDLIVERFENRITPIRDLTPDCPVELARIVEKALALAVTQRYQSAREMRTDLGMVRKGEAPIYAQAPREKPAKIPLSFTTPPTPAAAKEQASSTSLQHAMRNLAAAVLVSAILFAAGSVYIHLARSSRADRLLEGRYRGFLVGLLSPDGSDEIKIARDRLVTTVEIPAAGCARTVVTRNGAFFCGAARYRLRVELVDRTTATGTIERTDAEGSGRWSVIRVP